MERVRKKSGWYLWFYGRCLETFPTNIQTRRPQPTAQQQEGTKALWMFEESIS